MLRLSVLLAAVFFSSLVRAQICGTPQEPILARTVENKKIMIPLQRGAIKYVPVTFHLVAATNGTGRIPEENVLAQLANLNSQFADQEVLFYIDRFNYFDNDAVYNTPASAAARLQMNSRRDVNSINIFITNTANSGSGGPGVTLAYYDPTGDWIVARKANINGTSSTLAHEVGHFFSLAHPHAGWDCYPFTLDDYTNPVNVNFTKPCDEGGGSQLIELHDRSNCNDAGDRICDTPEDYNLGLLFQNNCAQNTVVMDKNSQLITPMTNNFMGYYTNCSSYEFTTTQKNLMNTDYFTPQRAYIRLAKVPDTDPVTDPVQYIYPIDGIETPGPSNILLDWEDVPGATHYLVVYDRLSSFTFAPVRTIVTASQHEIEEDLNIGSVYHWRVWPYNESQTGAGWTPAENFKVGTGTGINDIRDIKEFFIAPNPVAHGQEAVLTLSSTDVFEATLQLSGMSGQILQVADVVVPTGTSHHPIDLTQVPAGIYYVYLRSERGSLVERLLLID